MNDKTFSFLVGIFSVLNTIQFLIFDSNQVTFIGYEDKFNIYTDTNSEVVSWVVINRRNTSIGLSVVTIVVSCLLFYCLHVNNYVGLLCYVLWIIAYELINFSMVLLINGTIKEQFKELSYLHLTIQISRMLLHFLCLPLVTKHMYSLYKDPKMLGKMGRRRYSSISVVDLWPPVGPPLRPGTLYRKRN
ncbi:putative transmembrane protein 217B [Diceros bicornis minor]|uniref:Transmembrane protein 217 n=1 Tax=Diceros bicornis minor TaxID=77932 RepID=A0A7J7FP67_DICBM|nr:putative transmembrane protein 217B [Diceros bicornis minor]KAF5929668.1 hypothetical protein HPG69_002390 [Diceros bicornis minor]